MSLNGGYQFDVNSLNFGKVATPLNLTTDLIDPSTFQFNSGNYTHDLSGALGSFGGTGGGMAYSQPPGMMAGASNWLKDIGFLGSYDATKGIRTDGWGAAALSAGQGIMNGFMGMKQYGLAKDALKQNQRQFEQNYGAQRQMTNARLEDLHRARIASNKDAYEPIDSYMEKNKVR